MPHRDDETRDPVSKSEADQNETDQKEMKRRKFLKTRIISRFDLATGTRVNRGERFRYVLHCHILEHEDNDMMRPCDVVG
jgi:FtsP/CotA-like multicopper oxidase with cupredoxin domain